LKFATKHVTWTQKWRNVLFSDEKKFNLDGPDGFKFYWHCIGNNYEYYSKRIGGGQSLMVWGAFGYGGKLDLQICRGRMNAIGYQQLLENVNLIENGSLIAGENFIFQHDNAPPHSAHSTFNWFQEKNINLMQWPALSPDLNPMENMWGILSHRVYQNGKQYDSVVALERSIREEWDNINFNIITDLIESMEKRIYNVVFSHGKNSGH
jgi:hypothetical protein